MSQQLLSVNKLNIEIGTKQILRDVSLYMEAGEIISIVGESGSGKTTLIKSIMGILPPSGRVIQGEIAFDGHPVDSERVKSLRGREIAFVFQNPGSYFDPIMKIKTQFINCIRRYFDMTRGEAEAKAKTVLETLKFKDVQKVMDAYPHQLSGGMKQRVALALALVLDPKLIMADEPTSALDVLTQNQIMSEILSLRERLNTGFLIVTHNLGCAAQISDRIIVMKEGQIVETGTAHEIINRPQALYTRALIDSVPKLKGVTHEGSCY